MNRRRDQKKLPRATTETDAAARPAARDEERDREEDERESPAWRFIGAYLLLVLIGFMVFRHPATQVGGNELSVDRAMFTAVNAVTLTGFQQTLALDEYRTIGKVTALLLTVGGTLVTLIAGAMAVSRIARTGCCDRTIVIAAGALVVLAAAMGAVALPGEGRSIFQSIFQAVSAFGSSGLHLGVLPGVTEARAHLVLVPLSLLGGLGIPVILCVAHAVRRREPLHPYARLALLLWAGSYIIGAIALACLSGGDEFREVVASASVQSVNSRTTGLPFPMGEARTAQWVLIALMAVGGVSGAAAGGVKLTTLWTIVTGTRSAMRGDAPGRVFAIALAWLGGYALLVFVTLLALLATNPDQPGDRLLFLVVSAVSNVGLSPNPVAIVGPGMFILTGAMLLGRILPLAVLWWVAHVARDGDEMPVG